MRGNIENLVISPKKHTSSPIYTHTTRHNFPLVFPHLSLCSLYQTFTNMSSIEPQNHPTQSQSETITTNHNNIESEDHQNHENQSHVTSQLCLKHTHSSEKLDKDVVLRRFRHRRRVNKVQTVVKALVGSLFSTKSTDKVSAHNNMRWADDAFAAS